MTAASLRGLCATDHLFAKQFVNKLLHRGELTLFDKREFLAKKHPGKERGWRQRAAVSTSCAQVEGSFSESRYLNSRQRKKKAMLTSTKKIKCLKDVLRWACSSSEMTFSKWA